jgi:RNA polymerase II subunit A small phosphatase-like protein
MESKNEYKTLLILDLDETLMHAQKEPLEQKEAFKLFHFYVYLRPFLKQFLEEIKNDFLIAVWSSASDDYVEAIVERLFPEDYPLEFVWGRKRCTYRSKRFSEHFGRYLEDYETPYFYLKPLDKVKRKGYKLERILIVDDSPEKTQNNYGNAIYPSEFTGNSADDELLYLLNYLKTLKDVMNVRTLEKRGWRSLVENKSNKK